MATRSLPPPPPLSDLAPDGTAALFLDFDGTLVDIAPTPDGINVPADLAQRLEMLAERHVGRLALVTGRSLDNLAEHIGPVQVARAGSHGAHRIDASGEAIGQQPQPLDEEVLASLAEAAQRLGILLERKQHGAALHYRARPKAGDEVLDLAARIANAHNLDTKHGKCVVELVRVGADKGGAVKAFMATAPFAGAVPVFIGDDTTDEDGFVAAQSLGGAGIAVGERESANARFRLDSVAEVHEWLVL